MVVGVETAATAFAEAYWAMVAVAVVVAPVAVVVPLNVALAWKLVAALTVFGEVAAVVVAWAAT